jgi:CBS-domain-containing membrane protein
MSVLGSDERLNTIAEYADASVRLPRRGSLVAAPGAYGLKHSLYRRYGNRGNAIYTALGSFCGIALSGLCAWAFKQPLLFPSLGATAFLFFETPLAEVGTPRNAIIGHFVAIVAALAALGAFGLLGAPSAYVQGVTPARIGAVAFAVALTGGALRVLRAAHPPAGATTIIVASGLLASFHQVVAVAAGVVLLTAACWFLNRAFGIPAPVWAAPR